MGDEHDLFSRPGGWIEWGGGPQPVSDDTMVSVRYRNKYMTLPYVESCPARAAWFRIGFDWWRHLSPDPFNDIVAYRVVPSPSGDANE